MNSMFSIYALCGQYNDPEYNNLSEEERLSLDYMNECILSKNKKINDASFNIMLLLIELSIDPDKYTPEDIQLRKDEIYKELTLEEIDIMEKFIVSCINSMGIYSEESKHERKLRKERNDL